ncbi:adenosine 5'-monophosphoramidase HINT3-like [Culicoides brevitarsis]|uniref:adenosine 5'-monophosphoramidase HINT3-like n=1 Tax=Culicoides brevitarsis TaxID=469753 RepID=UPI00307CB7FE
MTTVENCIFCQIASKQAQETTIEHETDNIVIFKDIRPASDFHFLAVTKTHIPDPKHLTVDHKALIEEMRDSLKLVMERHSSNLVDSLFGFHWPPFNSVKHLHMHGIHPASTMGFFKRMIFKPESVWFKTTDYVLANLPPSNVSSENSTN